jgi:fluoroacetyl-CoA thioesterase
MEKLLQPGEMSVGAHVDVSHTAATPIGATVTATATYRGRDGKLFVFDVAAHDPAGEIGRGVHKRAIVFRDRLLAGAAKRRQGATVPRADFIVVAAACSRNLSESSAAKN